MYSTTSCLVNLKVETQKPFDILDIPPGYDYDNKIMSTPKNYPPKCFECDKFIEANGENSMEAVIRKLNLLLIKEIMAKFPEIKKTLHPEGMIWDKTYFSESLG